MPRDDDTAAAKQCALKIAASLRVHGVTLPPETIVEMTKFIYETVVAATDQHVGAIRRLGQLLAPDGPNRPPAVRQALRIIRETGIDYER